MRGMLELVGSTTVELLFHPQRFAVRITIISGMFENRTTCDNFYQKVVKAVELSHNKPIVCPVLIGRAADLTALYVLVDQAKRGEGQVALISGEAGIGKSRLVAEAKAYAANQGFLPLQGNCFQTDSAFPYAPLLDLLRSYFSGSSLVTGHNDLTPFAQELSQVLPDVTPLIPESTPLMLSSAAHPQQEKRRLITPLLRFFTQHPTHQALLFLHDDLPSH